MIETIPSIDSCFLVCLLKIIFECDKVDCEKYCIRIPSQCQRNPQDLIFGIPNFTFEIATELCHMLTTIYQCISKTIAGLNEIKRQNSSSFFQSIKFSREKQNYKVCAIYQKIQALCNFIDSKLDRSRNFCCFSST